MPRPKSELTKNRIFVGLHLTPKQHAEWVLRGAQKWARQSLDQPTNKQEVKS